MTSVINVGEQIKQSRGTRDEEQIKQSRRTRDQNTSIEQSMTQI
jgi:hypothetical protein